jgi:hypothetical protein
MIMEFRYSIFVSLVLANLLIAQTTVFQDTLDGDTWTAENSPYLIKGDITVENLIIQAGVTVIFESNYKFTVNGTLQAQGFYSDSIVFKPDSLNTAGWQGINFKNSSVASYLNYCRIEGAINQGIYIDQSIPAISNCRIVHNNGDGIKLRNTNIEVKYCVISHNTNNGIYLNAAQIGAENSIISDNSLNGILSTNKNDAITLLNTVIAKNLNIGISCQKGSLTVINSIIFDNNDQIYIVDNVPAVSYSAVQGITVYPGTGNINSIPGFEDFDQYTLSLQSPCIDAGNPDTAYDDKYFPPSLKGESNDMGAYGGPAASGWYPPLYIKPQYISFGKVPQDSIVSLSANILNYRDTGINVSEIIFQGDNSQVFAADKQNLFVPYSDSLELGLSFQPDQRSLFQADLVLRTSAYGDVHLPVSGEGIASEMNLLLPEIDFDLVALGSSAARFLPILNSGNDTLRINIRLLSDSVFSINKSSLLIGPGSLLDSIEVTFTPTQPVIFQDSLILSTNDPEKRRVAVPVKGAGASPAIFTDPQMIDFGNVALHADSLLNLIIGNSGRELLIIDSLKITGQPPDSIRFEIINLPAEFSTTLKPDSTLIVQIAFTPLRKGPAAAQLMIKSNDPFKSRIYVNLHGTGTAAEIILSATELNFGNVALQADSLLDLTIGNSGQDLLIIDSLKITGQSPDSMRFKLIDISPEFTSTLMPDSTLIVQIGFTPITTGPATAQVVIWSNDPFKNSTAVDLSGTGIAPEINLSATGLDFGQVYLDRDSLKTLNVYNRGLAVLTIPYAGLSVTGNQAAAFMLENETVDINVAAADSAIIKINFQPVQTGTNQAVLRISSNDPIDSVLVVQLSGIGIYDSSRVSISFDPLHSSNPFTNGQSATIRFTITGSYSIDSAFVYVRPGGSLNYTRLPLDQQSSEKWSAQIDALLVTERGLEYYVQADYGPSSTCYPVNGGQGYNAIQVAVPQIKFPWQTKKEIYQMISIPLATSGQDLQTLFQDELGPYDNTKYRIYELTDGIHYSEVVSLDKTLSPGKAIWLITKEPKDLIISDAQTITTGQLFELQLQQGWNLIATPFAFPVDWNQVSTELALRYYDGSDWPFASLLEPFKGYALYVPEDTVLLIPSQDATAVPKYPEKFQNPAVDGWRIQLSAESATARDLFNYVGAFKQATAGIDYCDYREPPPIGAFISLGLAPPDTPEKYSTDYRALEMGQYVFDFEVSCNIEEQIRISFREENLPENYDWIVASEENGIYYPQRVIQTTAKQSRYKIIIGTEQYIAAARLNFKQWPLTWNLEQNYPNPFNPGTTIKFSLAEAGMVTINLYNILGQKINTLLAGVKMEAGFHQIEWDGTAAAGERVSSGIYFLQLKTGKYNRSIKMILCR